MKSELKRVTDKKTELEKKGYVFIQPNGFLWWITRPDGSPCGIMSDLEEAVSHAAKVARG